MAEQYLSIKNILDKVLRHPLMQDLSLETAVDYAVDFMRIVGVPKMFTEKVIFIDTNGYRAKLPCDFYKIIQVRPIGGTALVASTDSFFMGGKYRDCNNTYKIQGNIIYTSLEKDTLELSYLAIEVDKDGYPLLPDNSSFTRALELYIKKQWFTILFDLGKITPAVLQNTQQEYAWAVGDCMTEFNRLSIDEMEAFSNSWRTMIIRDNQHSSGFADSGTRQTLKV
jgi:hypothetical protein